MVKNIILDVGKVLVAWEPEDAMKKLGFDDKTESGSGCYGQYSGLA